MTCEHELPAHKAPLVLLIDDAEDFRRLVGEFLEDNGFRVVIARNGFEGLKLAFASEPDVILMDLVMPGMDGVETARHLKRQAATAKIPIVALTGATILSDPSRYYAKGFEELLSKPHDPVHLLATLRRLTPTDA